MAIPVRNWISILNKLLISVLNYNLADIAQNIYKFAEHFENIY